MDYIVSNKISVAKLVAVGCDGTNVNTGLNNGIIRLLEEVFEKPLQWLVCQLHSTFFRIFFRSVVEGRGVGWSSPVGCRLVVAGRGLVGRRGLGSVGRRG